MNRQVHRPKQSPSRKPRLRYLSGTPVPVGGGGRRYARYAFLLPLHRFPTFFRLGIIVLLLSGTLNASPSVPLAHAASTDWVFPSWAYRTPITLSLTSGSLTQYPVMITTTSFGVLYAAGKLKSDCSDLRFTNSNGDILTFFAEVCDTAGGTSIIWVQVDTVTSPSTQILMYYGNPSATTASLSWSGSVVIMTAGSSIPTGWTSLADMNGRFPRGSSTSGTTGGSDTHGSGHTVTLSALTVNAESASNRADVSLMTCALTTHTHTVVSATVATATALPPYVSYPFSYNPSLPYAFPINSVIMMNGALLSGWTQATELTNKFPRGGVFGTSGGSATHTHPISGSLSASTGSATCGSTPTGYTSSVEPPHTHSFSGSVGAASSYPDRLSVVYIQNSALQPLQSGMVLMFLGTLPPLGWTRVVGLDDRYPVGNNTFGDTGSGAHSHSIGVNPIITTSGPSATPLLYYPTNQYWASGTHTHTITGSSPTSSVINLPAYYTVIFGQRQASLPTVALGTEQRYPTPYSVMFSTNIGSDSPGTVVTVNGMAETQGQLPYSVTASTVTYTFTQTVSSSTPGKQYVFTGVSGGSPAQNSATAAFTPTAAGTITATYKIQYLLSTQTSPVEEP